MKKLLGLAINLACLLILCGNAWSASYCIRADGTAVAKTAVTGCALPPEVHPYGDYTCASACSDATKCMTIDVSDGQTFSPDDVIFVCADAGKIRQVLNPPSAGTSGHPIRYQGSGSPVISGTDVVIGVVGDWTDTGGNVWTKALAVDPLYIVLFNNSVLGVLDATPDTIYEWAWAGGVFSVYSIGNPASYYSNIEAAQRNQVVYVTQGYNHFDNMIFEGSTSIAVQNTITTLASYSNSEIRWTYNYGFYSGILILNNVNISTSLRPVTISGTGAHAFSRLYITDWNNQGIDYAGTGSLLINNSYIVEETSYNAGPAISISSTGSVTIIDTEISRFATSGIYLSGAGQISFDNGYIHDGNGSAEIGILSTSTGTINFTNSVVSNMSGSSTGVGASMTTAAGFMNLSSNTFYGSKNDLIDIDTGTLVAYNNIFHIGAANANDVIDKAAGATYVGNNNLFWETGGAWSASYEGVVQTTIAGWRTASGQDANSLTPADPLFYSTANSQFQLTAGSPAIGAGTDLGTSSGLDIDAVWPGNVTSVDWDTYGWNIGAYAYPTGRGYTIRPGDWPDYYHNIITLRSGIRVRIKPPVGLEQYWFEGGGRTKGKLVDITQP